MSSNSINNFNSSNNNYSSFTTSSLSSRKRTHDTFKKSAIDANILSLALSSVSHHSRNMQSSSSTSNTQNNDSDSVFEDPSPPVFKKNPTYKNYLISSMPERRITGNQSVEKEKGGRFLPECPTIAPIPPHTFRIGNIPSRKKPTKATNVIEKKRCPKTKPSTKSGKKRKKMQPKENSSQASNDLQTSQLAEALPSLYSSISSSATNPFSPQPETSIPSSILPNDSHLPQIASTEVSSSLYPSIPASAIPSSAINLLNMQLQTPIPSPASIYAPTSNANSLSSPQSPLFVNIPPTSLNLVPNAMYQINLIDSQQPPLFANISSPLHLSPLRPSPAVSLISSPTPIHKEPPNHESSFSNPLQANLVNSSIPVPVVPSRDDDNPISPSQQSFRNDILQIASFSPLAIPNHGSIPLPNPILPSAQAHELSSVIMPPPMTVIKMKFMNHFEETQKQDMRAMQKEIQSIGTFHSYWELLEKISVVSDDNPWKAIAYHMLLINQLNNNSLRKPTPIENDAEIETICQKILKMEFSIGNPRRVMPESYVREIQKISINEQIAQYRLKIFKHPAFIDHQFKRLDNVAG